MKIYVPNRGSLIVSSVLKEVEVPATTFGTLTGMEIYNQVQNGGIEIEPFNLDQINPNSYNVRLGKELKFYTKYPLRFDEYNPTESIEIPEEGYELQPGKLYLGTTIERIYTDKFKPAINGRSSGGRLGLDVHKCAGFGDVGFNGQWTLEIEVIHPTVIKPGLEIAQISFDTLCGDTVYQYNGRYNNQVGTTASRFEENKKGKFSDVLAAVNLKKRFESLLIGKSNNLLRDLFEYIDFDAVYDVSYNLYEGESVKEDSAIFNAEDELVGYKYDVNNEPIYVRKQ